MTRSDKLTDGPRISLDGASSEALIGHVKDHQVLPVVDDLQDLAPLIAAGVHTCRVVGTGVEEDDAHGLCVVQVLQHALQVQTLSAGVEVSVGPRLQSSLVKYRRVVRPCGLWEVDDGVALEVEMQPLRCHTQRPRARQALRRRDVPGRTQILPIRQCHSVPHKVILAGDRVVFVVPVLVLQPQLLCTPHTRQHPWLTLIVPVSPDTQVDLPLVRVSEVRLVQPQNGVRRCRPHVSPADATAASPDTNTNSSSLLPCSWQGDHRQASGCW
mmetsp:Transcript_27289/g.78506  ORF Transcript_27289/g.78506 Transcript_27289/m.78506 type:complete len:270 (+) Transcript_27289:958-1767(+)